MRQVGGHDAGETRHERPLYEPSPTLRQSVIQRGNRRQPTFFSEGNYARYRSLLAEQAGAAGVAVCAWCLMPNHVHLILVPDSATG